LRRSLILAEARATLERTQPIARQVGNEQMMHAKRKRIHEKAKRLLKDDG
jgi:hypothetical protein